MDHYPIPNSERSENISGVIACINSMDIPFERLLRVYGALAAQDDILIENISETIKMTIPAEIGGEHENLRALTSFWCACTAGERVSLLSYFRDTHTAFMNAEDIGDFLPPDEEVSVTSFHPVDDQWTDMIQLLQQKGRFRSIWSMDEPECMLSTDSF